MDQWEVNRPHLLFIHSLQQSIDHEEKTTYIPSKKGDDYNRSFNADAEMKFEFILLFPTTSWIHPLYIHTFEGHGELQEIYEKIQLHKA